MSCSGVTHRFPMRSRVCECGDQVIGEPRFSTQSRRLSDPNIKGQMGGIGGKKGDLIDDCRLSEVLRKRYSTTRAFQTL